MIFFFFFFFLVSVSVCVCSNASRRCAQDYSAFLYLLRLEPAFLAKALMGVPYGAWTTSVRILNFSLFPDLFQAREEIFLLDLVKVFCFVLFCFVLFFFLFCFGASLFVVFFFFFFFLLLLLLCVWWCVW